MALMYYTDGAGRTYRVFSGLGGGLYKAYYQEPGGAAWYDVPTLPWRTTPERAEIDLWDYARANRLRAQIYGKGNTAPSRTPRQVEPAPRSARGFGRDRGGAWVKPIPVPLVRAMQVLTPEELRRAKRKRQRDYQRELREADREVARAKQQRTYNRQYYEAHREEKLRKAREWREKRDREQKENHRAYCKQYYQDHREEIIRKRREKCDREQQEHHRVY